MLCLENKLMRVLRIQDKRISDAETDNNYQSYQSFTIKIKHKNNNYWTKIGKIGNYCQLEQLVAYI